jgi:catechol 2,3-dioxygenase-like lactoylglutathione lyase family enzyme
VTLGGAALIAFAPTLDLDRSHAFYGGVLGLETIERSPFANAYDVAGTQLRVTRVPQLTPQGFTVLGWKVDDVARAIAALRESGVEFHRYDGMDQDDDGVWTSPSSARIAWFADPDGNTLSLQSG